MVSSRTVDHVNKSLKSCYTMCLPLCCVVFSLRLLHTLFFVVSFVLRVMKHKINRKMNAKMHDHISQRFSSKEIMRHSVRYIRRYSYMHFKETQSSTASKPWRKNERPPHKTQDSKLKNILLLDLLRPRYVRVGQLQANGHQVYMNFFFYRIF